MGSGVWLSQCRIGCRALECIVAMIHGVVHEGFTNGTRGEARCSLVHEREGRDMLMHGIVNTFDVGSATVVAD